MAHLQVAHLAALLGALGAVLTLAVRGRVPLLAGFVALGLADACLGYALVPASDLRRLTHHLAGWGLIAALAITVAAVAVMLVRYPAATPVALLVVAPFRLPVQLGDQKAFLLLPFYGVVAGAVVALAYRALRGDELPTFPPLLSFPLALVAVLTSVSFLWSRDPRAGAIALGFFYFPFVAGVAVVARSPLVSWVPRALATTLVAFATLFAAIGLWQAQTRRLFFAPDLEVANAYTTFFRVTSLFKDPSLYGLHLVLAIAVLLVAVWLRRVGPALAVGVIAFLSAGLYFSYSQSSFIALFAVTLAVAVVFGNHRLRLALAVCAAIAVVGGTVVAARAVASSSAREATSGRSRLVTVTFDAFRASPVYGVGIGGQPKASLEESGAGSVKKDASHTTPLTVAAELGVIGFAAFVLLLAAEAWALLLVTRRRRALGLTLAAVLLTLFVHSLFYAGFFENPITWGVIGITAAALSLLARTEPALAALPFRPLIPRAAASAPLAEGGDPVDGSPAG